MLRFINYSRIATAMYENHTLSPIQPFDAKNHQHGPQPNVSAIAPQRLVRITNNLSSNFKTDSVSLAPILLNISRDNFLHNNVTIRHHGLELIQFPFSTVLREMLLHTASDIFIYTEVHSSDVGLSRRQALIIL